MSAARRATWAIFAIALCSFLGTMAIEGFNNARLREATERLRTQQEIEERLLSRVMERSGDMAKGVRIQEMALWTKGENGQAEAQLQRALNRAANEAGVTIISFGASAPIKSANVPTLAYEMEAEGGHDEMARMLEDLETNEPPLAVSYLWVRQKAGLEGRAGAPVTFRITVWGFLSSEAEAE